MLIQIIHQLLLGFLTASQKLHGAITMRTDALTTPHQWLDGGIL